MNSANGLFNLHRNFIMGQICDWFFRYGGLPIMMWLEYLKFKSSWTLLQYRLMLSTVQKLSSWTNDHNQGQEKVLQILANIWALSKFLANNNLWVVVVFMRSFCLWSFIILIHEFLWDIIIFDNYKFCTYGDWKWYGGYKEHNSIWYKELHWYLWFFCCSLLFFCIWIMC